MFIIWQAINNGKIFANHSFAESLVPKSCSKVKTSN